MKTLFLLLATLFGVASAQADVAILCAHPKEFGQFVSNFESDPEITEVGVRKFYKGATSASPIASSSTTWTLALLLTRRNL